MADLLQPQFVEVAGRRLRHLVLGDGRDAVVLVHGFAGSLENWSSTQPALADAGYTVAALDLPGHGQSSLDVGSGSLDELAAIVQAYLEALGAARAHLVGHSMGAALCLALVDRVPERVRSLALLGPAGLGQKIDADYVRGMVSARSRAELEPLLAKTFADPAHLQPGLVARCVEHKARAGASDALGRIAGSRHTATPSGRTLRELAGTVPTVLVWGVHDRVIAPPAPGEFVDPGILLRVLPGAGHLVQLEAPEEVNRILIEFLDERRD